MLEPNSRLVITSLRQPSAPSVITRLAVGQGGFTKVVVLHEALVTPVTHPAGSGGGQQSGAHRGHGAGGDHQVRDGLRLAGSLLTYFRSLLSAIRSIVERSPV